MNYLLNFIKNNRYFCWALVFILTVGAGLIIFVRMIADDLWEGQNSVVIEMPSPQIGSIISVAGTVEIKNDGDWTAAKIDSPLYFGSGVKTKADSTVIVLLDQDIIILAANSEIEVGSVNKSNILVNQISGQTYSIVEKKENQQFVVLTLGAKITALGTEFLVDVPTDQKTLAAYSFKNKISVEYQEKHLEITEQNKLSLNFETKELLSSALSDFEKNLNQPFLALVGKEATAIAEKKVAARAKTGAATTASTPASAPTTGSSSGNSGSSGGNSGGGGSGGDSPQIFGRYSSSSVESIVNSLALVHDDGVGDFVNPGSGYPPSGVYPYSPIDADNLYLGTSGDRLYIKFSLDGTMPTSRQTENGNVLEQLTWNFIIDTDGNTNNNCFGSEKAIAFNIAYHSDGKIWYNVYGWSSCNGGTYDGVQPSLSGTFHNYNAGLGKKSAVVSFALSDLGISAGNSINVKFWSEVESDLWHHYSFDDGAWANWTVE